jgi:hypothetical protein
VIAGFVRGLSVRDVENTLADALGAEAALSKSTVSRVLRVTEGGDDGVIEVDEDRAMKMAPLGVVSGAVVGAVTALSTG